MTCIIVQLRSKIIRSQEVPTMDSKRTPPPETCNFPTAHKKSNYFYILSLVQISIGAEVYCGSVDPNKTKENVGVISVSQTQNNN